MSASKSWLVSSIGQGLLVLHPLTNGGTGRGTDVGTDTGRVTDSKPGGSDGVTDEMLLLGGSSSTTASLRGGCTATGAWIGAGTGATTLLSWFSWGTSETRQGKTGWATFVRPPLIIKSKLYFVLNLPISISSTEDEPWENWINAEEIHWTMSWESIDVDEDKGKSYVAYLVTWCIVMIRSSQNIQGRLLT